MAFIFEQPPLEGQSRLITQAISTVDLSQPQEKNDTDHVQFPLQCANFRYKMTIEEGTIQFWLEDTSTKKQWESKKLRMNEFITPDTAIPHAGFTDYVACFRSCLEADIVDESSTFSRNLVPLESDNQELRLTLQTKVFVSIWTLSYSFLLKKIPLNPIDMLLARIRDQGDRIMALECEIEQLKLTAEQLQEPMCIQAMSTKNRGNGQRIIWTQNGDLASQHVNFADDGFITVNTAGVYVIHVVVHAISSLNDGGAYLGIGNSVKAFSKISRTSCVVKIPLNCVLTLGPADQLSILFRHGNQNRCWGDGRPEVGESKAGSTLVMTRLR